MIHDILCGDSESSREYPCSELPVGDSDDELCQVAYDAGISSVSECIETPASLLLSPSEYYVPGGVDPRGGFLSALKKANWGWLPALCSAAEKHLPGTVNGQKFNFDLRPYSGDNAVWNFLGVIPLLQEGIEIQRGEEGEGIPSEDYQIFGAASLAYMTGYEVSRQQRISAEMAKLKAEVSSLESEVKTLKTAVPKTKRLYMCLGLGIGTGVCGAIAGGWALWKHYRAKKVSSVT